MKTKVPFLCIPLVLLFLAGLSMPAQGAIPGILKYQGRILVNDSNYTGTAEFKFALVSPPGNTNVTATARAIVQLGTGRIASISVLNPGSGYPGAPGVSITPHPLQPAGSGASAVAVVSNGRVTAINVTSPGSGYSTLIPPIVRVQPPPVGLGVETYWSNDGTSEAGAMPTDSVSIDVEGGLYSVLLGDASIPNMDTIPTTVFQNANVNLRVWFDDGTTGFQLLEPDQRIAAVGYALVSATVPDGAIGKDQLANNSITSDKIANGQIGSADLANNAVTAGKIAAGAIRGTNIVNGQIGATQIEDNSITGDQIADGSIGSIQLADTIDLGATSVDGLLNVYHTAAGTPGVIIDGSQSRVTTYGSDGLEQIQLTGTSFGVLNLRNNRVENRVAVQASANGSSGGRLRLYNTNGNTRAELYGANSGGTMTLYNGRGLSTVFVDGHVGQGYGYMILDNTNGSGRVYLYGQSPSSSPGSQTGGEVSVRDASGTETIELLAQETSTEGGTIILKRDNGTIGMALEGEVSNNNGGAIRLYNTAGDERAYLSGDSSEGGYFSVDTADGGVGIVADGDSGGAGLLRVYGTNSSYRVELDGDGENHGGTVRVRDTSGNSTLILRGAETGTSGGDLRMYKSTGLISLELDGEAGDGNGGWIGLYNQDEDRVITLDADDSTGAGRVITQVLQITGGSDLSEQFDVGGQEGEMEPGMLVCIDPDNPGKLIRSTKAYDRTAAGVISGAGGVKTGMLMGQEGTIANGKYPVALTGRVYCMVDADQGGAIEPGDLITTSDTPGHGMKVTDHSRAQGAIVGKAMTRLKSGKGLVLVLVSLQ